MNYKKKLIEVALPLDVINEQSAREKSIRHGHPSTLHLWWARRPLAATRAVIFSSLVDDPSSHPDLFPTEEAQQLERERLFNILERLVNWDNINDQGLYEEARVEMLKSMDGELPPLFDPFAGGGAIPLEAQRLGLEAYASDLNPVAVMINKAMIEIPPKFANQSPVNPNSRNSLDNEGWKGASGLAEDVRYYGELLKKEAFLKIGHLYPTAKDKHGIERTVIAWLWARTIKCPNPACGCEMPLANSFQLSSSRGVKTHVHPVVEKKTIHFKVGYGAETPVSPKIGRGQFKCIACNQPAPSTYVRSVFQKHEDGVQLMAIVVEGDRERTFLSPIQSHEKTALEVKPIWKPEESMNQGATDLVSGRGYGFMNWHQLFTDRQLAMLTTLSDLIPTVQSRVEADSTSAGLEADQTPLRDGGRGAKAYSDAITVFLSFIVDKLADYHSSVCSWNASREIIRNIFGRQAIPMVWDYAEANPFSNSSGSYNNMLNWITKSVIALPVCNQGTAKQFDAQSDIGLRNIMVSTDPPYYDNISYADLSDYFYIWMRRNLKDIYPSLFRTMLVPKAEELVATPYRFDGNVMEAQSFFEDGMYKTCQQLYKYTREDIPVTIYYAYKQSERDSQNGIQVSTGWETMLSAIIRAGFSITGTWPMRTEKPGRTLSIGTNALASSIVLVCRKRSEIASECRSLEFRKSLKAELKDALRRIQSANLAPVDLAQSVIGPGMAIFSRYSRVLEADGSAMTVRTALQIINQELDAVLSDQEVSRDSETRFCVELYKQFGFKPVRFGDADVLARAKNTSVDKMERLGLVSSERGVVALVKRENINPDLVRQTDSRWLISQILVDSLSTGGIDTVADILLKLRADLEDDAKALAYRLFSIADHNGWAEEAFDYNALVKAWPSIQQRKSEIQANKQMPVQVTFLTD